MVRSVNVLVSEGTLRESALESRLTEATKSQILRFALLRTIMSAREARETVFGTAEQITETDGHVSAKIPEHEIKMITEHFPDLELSEIARAGFALATGEPHERAWKNAKLSRGPKPRKSKDAA